MVLGTVRALRFYAGLFCSFLSLDSVVYSAGGQTYCLESRREVGVYMQANHNRFLEIGRDTDGGRKADMEGGNLKEDPPE